MGVLDLMAIGGGAAFPPGPGDDYWYTAAPGVASLSGARVDPEQAKKISAWYRGRDLLATSLAMLPLPIFERLADDAGATSARSHPLYDILHRKPNDAQDAFQWKRQMMCHLIDHGNGYNYIREGRRGFVDQLVPIADPRTVTPRMVSTGRKVYDIRDPKTNLTRTYTSDDIFHLMGSSDDGVAGKGILEHARDSVGTAIATEQYAATVFSRGTLNGGVIQNPGKLDADAAKRMAQSFITAAGNWHLPKVLEQGSTWVPNELTPEDAQMLLSRKFSIDDIARWLGVPPHMIGSLDRATNNNIEHQGQEFVTYSLGPWLSLWEFAINDQLILIPSKYYAEFTRDALVRGDIATRWRAHVEAVNAGIKTVDEVRVKENLNRRGGKADELREPQNITGRPTAGTGDDAEPFPSRPRRPVAVEDDEDAEQARAIVVESAARVLRKEVRAVQRLAVKHAADVNGFAVAVTAFYADHQALLGESLLMTPADAAEYCASQSAQVLEHGVRAVEAWATAAYAEGLAAWALASGRAA